MDFTKHRPNQTLSYQSSEIYQHISLNCTAIIDNLNSHNIDKSISPYWHIEESYWHSAASYWHSPLLRAKYRLGMMDLKSYWTLHYTVWNQISIMFFIFEPGMIFFRSHGGGPVSGIYTANHVLCNVCIWRKHDLISTDSRVYCTFRWIFSEVQT